MARTQVGGPEVVPSCGQIALLWEQEGQRMSNIMHSQLVPTGPIDPTAAEQIFSGIKAAAATTTWLANVHPSCSLIGVEVKDLRSAHQSVIQSTGPAVPGTGTGSPLSQMTAMAVTLRTAQSGAGFRGRVYLPGLDEGTLLNARRFTDVAGAAAVAFVQGVQNVYTPIIGIPVVAQRALNADPNSSNPEMQQPRPAGTVPITGVNIANPRVDTQRRRAGR